MPPIIVIIVLEFFALYGPINLVIKILLLLLLSCMFILCIALYDCMLVGSKALKKCCIVYMSCRL